MDHLATAVSNRPHENAVGGIETVNCAAVGVVRDCVNDPPPSMLGDALQ